MAFDSEPLTGMLNSLESALLKKITVTFDFDLMTLKCLRCHVDRI